MKRVLAALAALLFLGSALPAYAAAKPSPTPPPLEIEAEVIREVPEEIQQLLDLAYSELVETNGKNLGTRNKYTKWRNNGQWGWCGGFITWCLLELGVPQKEWAKTETGEVEGLHHVKEGGVGKLVTGYLRMNRTTMTPQKGFIVVYGKVKGNGLWHVGLVYDVQRLPDGTSARISANGSEGCAVVFGVLILSRYLRSVPINGAWQKKNIGPLLWAAISPLIQSSCSGESSTSVPQPSGAR